MPGMPDAPRPLDRRSFLAGVSASAGAFLLTRPLGAASLPDGAGRPDGKKLPRGAFRFIVVNDLHHASPECDPFFEALVAQMRGHDDVAFCLIVGDLSDKGRPESLQAIRRIFPGLGVPVHTVPGNHDNDGAGDTSLYAATFPDALNYAFEHRGWQFIGLDSTDGYNWGDTTISPATLGFLDDRVPGLDRRAPTVVYTHFPLAPGMRLAPVNCQAVLERLAPLNLRAAFCGHYHSRTIRPHGAALLMTNVCCARVRSNHDGTRPEGYLVCTAHADGRLVQEFVEFRPATENPAAPHGMAG